MPAGGVDAVADGVEYTHALCGGSASLEERDEVSGGMTAGRTFDEQRLPADVVQTHGRGQSCDTRAHDLSARLAM
ncbi:MULTISPECIES: hypothetical protein [unclassified Streptomyces]|uniref:hypothetical protein n=1 Tax=Streptomyces sp. NBC_00723 TaxID=2903673 RepID=UPI00131CDA82